MRWETRTVDGTTPLPGLELGGLLRTVRAPEFAGVTFHEVAPRTAVNRVPPTAGMPFRWSLNPMRGCLHACAFCYARRSHEYLDLGAGEDFETQIVVKTTIVEVLRRELRRPSWQHEHVAVGTTSDPYQRAEGRYALMPGIVEALATSGTPFSVTTRGTLLRRDLPLLADAAGQVRVGVNVSLGLLDAELARSLEPGAPTPRVRLELIRAVREAGLPCHVFLAPVLPWLTDGDAELDGLLAAIAAAGATGVSVIPLNLPGSVRGVFFGWLARAHPELVPRYDELFSRRTAGAYGEWLRGRVAPLLARHGFDGRSTVGPAWSSRQRGAGHGSGGVAPPVVAQPALF